MAHIHSVFDSNEHFVIDPVTRAITNSLAKKIVVMQFDHNSERFTFKIPKVDGHNMENCDRVEIHYINIDAVDKTLKSTGVYEVDDIQISPDDNSVAVFSWLLSRNCTQYAGTLNFLIHFACTTDGVEDYAWNTAIFQSITIGNGMNNGAEVVEPFPDILAQWQAQLFSASETAVLNVTTAEANALAAIEAAGEAKKQAVLDSIPDEYEAMSAMVDQSHRNKAGAIVLDVEGESIVVKDASEYPLQNLKVFGKSTQDGTPTPDAPVEIVNIGASGKVRASVHGINLIPYPFTDKTKTVNGITFTDNGDGTITVNGTATGYADFTLYKNTDKPLCTEGFLHGCPVGGSNESFSLRVSDLVTKSGTDIGNGCGVYCEAKYIFIRVLTGTTVNDLTFAPMVNVGLSAMPFEKGAEKQEVEIETPTSLPGIPVSSGGNYTDADGQQWICDEVDLARGVYVKRIQTLTFDGTEAWGVGGEPYMLAFISEVPLSADNVVGFFSHGVYQSFSSTLDGFYAVVFSNGILRIRLGHEASVEEFKAYLLEQYTNGTPVTICYPLATPIETPLSEAEISAFKALHSNRPNTVILNDAGAHMAVSYVADTKTYIDNKIAEMMKGVTE